MRQRINRWGGWLYSHVPGLRELWARRTRSVAQQAAVPWVALGRPLGTARIALITTGGVHLHSQAAFDMADSAGDPSFRVIPAATDYADLMITHNYYDHRDAERDLNILFPLRRLEELAAEGVIGSVATAYSFMGHITAQHLDTLLSTTAPAVARQLRRDRVDAVVLTPA